MSVSLDLFLFFSLGPIRFFREDFPVSCLKLHTTIAASQSGKGCRSQQSLTALISGGSPTLSYDLCPTVQGISILPCLETKPPVLCCAFDRSHSCVKCGSTSEDKCLHTHFQEVFQCLHPFVFIPCSRGRYANLEKRKRKSFLVPLVLVEKSAFLFFSSCFPCSCGLTPLKIPSVLFQWG